MTVRRFGFELPISSGLAQAGPPLDETGRYEAVFSGSWDDVSPHFPLFRAWVADEGGQCSTERVDARGFRLAASVRGCSMNLTGVRDGNRGLLELTLLRIAGSPDFAVSEGAVEADGARVPVFPDATPRAHDETDLTDEFEFDLPTDDAGEVLAFYADWARREGYESVEPTGVEAADAVYRQGRRHVGVRISLDSMRLRLSFWRVSQKGRPLLRRRE